MNRTSKYALALSAALLIGAPRVMAEQQQTKQEHQQLFQRMDKNGDKQITQDEFMAAYREDFQEVDKDGDQKLSVEEQQQLSAKWQEESGTYSRARLGESGSQQQSETQGMESPSSPGQSGLTQ